MGCLTAYNKKVSFFQFKTGIFKLRKTGTAGAERKRRNGNMNM